MRVVRIRDKRDSYHTAIQPLTFASLRQETAEVATFLGGRGGATQVVPPEALVRNLLATPPDRIPLLPLTRIVFAPTVGPDGTVQTTPGYQPASSVYYVDSGLVIPPVAERPSDDDISKAADLLTQPLVDFPFVGEAEQAHALAFGLLPFVRDLISGPTPLHLIEKPTAGTGATLLADVLLFPSCGQDVAKLSEVRDEDEWRKQITSTLLQAPAAVIIDNVRSLSSAQLAKAITDRIWKARILGVSRDAEVSVECAWAATGNNPDLHQEIARRAVRIRLDAHTDQPFRDRTFKIPNLRAWCEAHRGELIWASLTLVRAWFAADRPSGQLTLGSFERWAEVMGGILSVAEIPGFLGNIDEFYEAADVESEAIAAFVEQWALRYRTRSVRTADFSWALEPDSPLDPLFSARANARGRSTWMGQFLRRLRDRVVSIEGAKVMVTATKRKCYALKVTSGNLDNLENLLQTPVTQTSTPGAF